MLHIGCGDTYFAGWINIDNDSSKADLLNDVSISLPFKNDCVDYIYSEHFVEHITVEQAIHFFKESHRVLRPNGVMRVATPNLRYVLFKYFFFWKRQEWIQKGQYDFLKTKAEMINLAFRGWGHQYLYDLEEITRRLRQAGFLKVSRKRWNASKYAELRNREYRKDSKLIVEAIKD
jgi:predicted SAM-dependent methyltransferase